MNRREKILIGAVAAFALFLAGRAALDWYLELYSVRNQRIAALQQEIQKKQQDIVRGQRAQKRLAEYERRSLPADSQLARAAYHNWLLARVQEAKLAGADVTAQTAVARRENFDRLTYNVNGRGSLEQLVKLLYEFYSAGHLHKLKRLNVEPVESGSTLDLSLTIEALALKTAEQQVELADVPGDRLAEKDWEAYRRAIVGRNVFAAYVPPPVERREPPPEPPKPPFDVARYAFVTAIVAVDGRPQVWVLVRTTGQTLKLFEGDHFEVGNVGADVVSIGKRSVEIAVGEQRLLAMLGESLRDAAALPKKE